MHLDQMSARDRFLVANKDVLGELRAAVRDLPFLDTLGQIDGAYFHREGSEWHWAVKTQPLLQTSLQSSEQEGYNEGDYHGYHGQGSMLARGASMTSYPFSARGNPLQSRTASGPDLSDQPRWEVGHSEIYSDNDDSRGSANCTDWTGDAEEDAEEDADAGAEDNRDHDRDHYPEEDVEVDGVDEVEDTEKEQDSSNQSCGERRTSSGKLLPLNSALSLSYPSKNISGEKESNGEEPDEEDPDEEWSGGEGSDEDVSDFEETPHGFQQRQKLLREQSKLLSQIRPRQQQQPDQTIPKKYTQKKNTMHHQTSSHSLKRCLAESEGEDADRTFSPPKKLKQSPVDSHQFQGRTPHEKLQRNFAEKRPLKSAVASFNGSFQDNSPKQSQTPTQVVSSSLKRSASERDDDSEYKQQSSPKGRCAGDVSVQQRSQKSSKILLSSDQQQTQQPDRNRQPMPAKTTFGTAVREENIASQKTSKGKNAAWNDTEYDGLHKLLMEQRAHEKATNQKLLRDVKLWSLMSDRLKEFHNIERSPASCRAFWSRDGRTRSKFDERANPNPNMLATCLQGKKNGKIEGVKTTKEGEDANSQEEGYEEEDQEYESQGEDFQEMAPEDQQYAEGHEEELTYYD